MRNVGNESGMRQIDLRVMMMMTTMIDFNEHVTVSAVKLFDDMLNMSYVVSSNLFVVSMRGRCGYTKNSDN